MVEKAGADMPELDEFEREAAEHAQRQEMLRVVRPFLHALGNGIADPMDAEHVHLARTFRSGYQKKRLEPGGLNGTEEVILELVEEFLKGVP